MWIFTVNGFFTIIQDRKDANYVWLRARLREDIERNFPGVEVTEHPGADYLYRAKLPREQVAQRVLELVMENNVTSHFKDVMIRTASKPEFGSRSNMLYGVWNAGAAMQPFAPYSRTPRAKAPVKTWKPGDRTTGTGQTSLPATGSQGLYGGAGAGRYASEFDWDRSAWGGGEGVSHADPRPAAAHDTATDEEFEEWWAGLSSIERDEYLDAAEAEQREREQQTDEDFGAAARAAEFLAAPQVADVFPTPRSRSGNRKQRRKARRANRHNQREVSQQQAYAEVIRAQRNREGLNGQEAQNRQTYLDKKEQQRNGKGA